MSFLSAQGSNAIFKNTIVNDLTIKGKLIITQDSSGSTIPDNINVDTISSFDNTNEIDFSTANVLTYKSLTNNFEGDIALNGHYLNSTGRISGVNGVLQIASGNQLHLSGAGNINNCKLQGSYIDWNDDDEKGKMCLITNRGLGPGGFAFYNVRTDSSGNVDSTTTNEIFNIDGSGGTTIYSVTDSTSVSTGALIVDGGVGIAKNVNVGGIATITNSTNSTAVGNGAMIIDGGLSVAKNSNIAGITTVTNTTDSTAVGNGAMIIDGGLSVAKNSNIAGITTITNTTDSTAVGNGAMIIDGGLSVAKNNHLAGITTITNTTDSTAVGNGAMVIDGGLSVAKNSNIAGITTVTNATDSTAVGNGAMVIDGGLSVAKNSNIAGITTITNATDSTGVGNGAVVIDGGLSVAKNNHLAGMTHITNATNSTSSSSGALYIDGGVGIQKDLHIAGNIVCSGQVTSSNSSLYQEFHYYNLQGNAGNAGGTISINNSQGNTNYMVFSSIYYGYSGSGGTYNAVSSSSAVSTMIISNITTTSFVWNLVKATGDNDNLYIVFNVVFSPELNFAKSY